MYHFGDSTALAAGEPGARAKRDHIGRKGYSCSVHWLSCLSVEGSWSSRLVLCQLLDTRTTCTHATSSTSVDVLGFLWINSLSCLCSPECMVPSQGREGMVKKRGSTCRTCGRETRTVTDYVDLAVSAAKVATAQHYQSNLGSGTGTPPRQ